VAPSKLSIALTQLMCRMLRHTHAANETAAAAAAVCVQYEGNWNAAHIKLSTVLIQLMGRMLQVYCCCCCCCCSYAV
jgi:hypothetical protein